MRPRKKDENNPDGDFPKEHWFTEEDNYYYPVSICFSSSYLIKSWFHKWSSYFTILLIFSWLLSLQKKTFCFFVLLSFKNGNSNLHEAENIFFNHFLFQRYIPLYIFLLRPDGQVLKLLKAKKVKYFYVFSHSALICWG